MFLMRKLKKRGLRGVDVPFMLNCLPFGGGRHHGSCVGPTSLCCLTMLPYPASSYAGRTNEIQEDAVLEIVSG